jgi:hypothetical protein
MKPLIIFLYILLSCAFLLSCISLVIASTIPSSLNTPTVIQLNAKLNALKVESSDSLLLMNQINYTDYDKSQNNCTYDLNDLNATLYQLYADLLVFDISVNISYASNISSLGQTGKVTEYLVNSYLVESNVTFNFSYNGFQLGGGEEFLYFHLFPTGETEFTASNGNYTQIHLDGLSFNCRFCNASLGVFTVDRISTAPHVAGFSQLLYNVSSLQLQDGLMYQGDILAVQDDFYF